MTIKIATDLLAGDRVISPAGETMIVESVELITIRKGARIRATMVSGSTVYLPLSESVTLAA